MHYLTNRAMATLYDFARRQWLVVIIAWLTCIVGWPVVLFAPEQYISTGRVVIDTDSLLRPLLRGITVDIDPNQQIGVITRSMISRANLEKAAKLAGDGTGSADSVGERVADSVGERVADSVSERVIADLRANTQVKAERNGLFTISYQDTDPHRAYRMASALLDVFMQAYLGSTRNELASAQEFLAEQIGQYEERVREVEARLAAFKHDNEGLLPGGASFLEHMARAQQEAETLRADMEDAKARRAELVRMLESQPPYLEVEGGAANGPPSGLETRILEIEQRLDDLRLRYTDQHPDVVHARQLLAQLRAEMTGLGPDGEAANGRAGRNMVPNELHRNIQMKLIDLDTQVAAQRNTLVRKLAAAKDLRSRVARAPEVEAQLVRLTREHDMARRNHEELLARQDSARLSHNREMQSEKVQFRVIDPPQVPTKAAGLPRSMMATGVLLAGIVAGIAIGLLKSLMHKTFVSPAQLAEVTGLPVLGAVSSLASRRSSSGQMIRIAALAGCWAALLSLYAGVIVIERHAGLSVLRSRLVAASDLTDRTPPPRHLHG